ncbi:MAG TPA: alpha/beta hydrolase [Gemmatimonadales bacterium]|nr:alpha/beta hydrolase [Gemmatimonadales bacterium]
MIEPGPAAVIHREGRFSGANGLQLFYQAWLPAGGRRDAVLVNLHGLGDHSGLYPNLAAHFPTRRLALYAYDMRGNGRSPGQRAYLSGWHEYRDDLRAFLNLVWEWEAGMPVFLLGNSLGGLVVLDYALHFPEKLAGVIAAAPPLGKLGVPPFLMSLGRVMSRVAPRFSLRVGMDLTGLARDPAVIEAVLADPYFHRVGTARLSTEVTAAISRVHALADRLSVPLLILHGAADRMVPPDGSREFFAKVQHPDRELREYPEAYHGLFADFEHGQVLADVDRWIRARIPAREFPAGGSRE